MRIGLISVVAEDEHSLLFRVYCDSETDEDERDEKDVVRGYQFAEYHADVYDKTESELTSAGLDCECLGGGRIEHKPQQKYIKVSPTSATSSLTIVCYRCMGIA